MANQTVDSSSHSASELKVILIKKGLRPTDDWISSFLNTQRANLPVSALASTASFRLLASNITTTFNSTVTPGLPADVQNATIKERNLPHEDVVVQVLDVEDMGSSRWEQIQALEAIERGEDAKGREIIRLEQTGEDEGDQAPTLRSSSAIVASSQISRGPHKLLLQDASGATAYGMEMQKIDGIGMNMNLGSKLVLRGATVSRGVILLETSTTTWLGGKIEALHQMWIKGKKQRLLAAIAA